MRSRSRGVLTAVISAATLSASGLCQRSPAPSSSPMTSRYGASKEVPPPPDEGSPSEAESGQQSWRNRVEDQAPTVERAIWRRCPSLCRSHALTVVAMLTTISAAAAAEARRVRASAKIGG